MYNTEIIKNIIDEAKILVTNKRKKYDQLMKIIEEFISENDIYVKEISDYFFNLYTNDMFNLPIQLTDLLYNYDPILAKYATLEIKIYKYHSRISIDGIQFVHFTYINPEIRQNILKYSCSGLYTNLKCKCFGPEIILINIYADLINPSLSNNWSNLYKVEENLSNEIINDLDERVGGVEITKQTLIGQMMDMYYGNLLKTSIIYNKNNFEIEYLQSFNKSENIHNYKQILINNYICDDHVLIGKTAINIYNKTNKIARLQIITSKTFNNEIDILKDLLGSSISYSINNLKIPTNLNLHKLTIYINKEAIIDIYNAGNFEVINYNRLTDLKSDSNIKSSINIGTPFVIMRFRLIDIWYTLYNIKTGNIVKNIGMPVIFKLITNYIEMRKLLNLLNLTNIFSINYIGFFEDQILNKLRIAARLKIKFIPPYIPFLKK